MLKPALLCDFLTHEALIDHPYFGSIALDVLQRWGVGKWSDFVADFDGGKGQVPKVVHKRLI